MGRSSESKQIVKRNLEDYNLRSFGTPEIFHALDRAQQKLATNYDLIRKVITLNTIDDITDYDIVVTDDVNVNFGSFIAGKLYQITFVGTSDFTSVGAASNNIGIVFIATESGTGAGLTGKAEAAFRYVRKITSWQVPFTWVGLIWKTDQQWDELLEEQPAVSLPQYIRFRNNILQFHGAPTIDDESVILTTFLHTPILNMDDSVEPVTPSIFDEAMEHYAIHFLLPNAHPQKEFHSQKFDALAERSFGRFHNTVSKPIVPKANW